MLALLNYLARLGDKKKMHRGLKYSYDNDIKNLPTEYRSANI